MNSERIKAFQREITFEYKKGIFEDPVQNDLSFSPKDAIGINFALR
jgi:hypothetical protein